MLTRGSKRWSFFVNVSTIGVWMFEQMHGTITNRDLADYAAEGIGFLNLVSTVIVISRLHDMRPVTCHFFLGLPLPGFLTVLPANCFPFAGPGTVATAASETLALAVLLVGCVLTPTFGG